MNTATVHLAVYNTLADWEPGHALAHLRTGSPGKEADYGVATVGPTADPVTTMGGVRVLPDIALADLDPAHSAMLILPGAELWDADPPALAPFARAARGFLDAGVPVAAICGATAGLAREGLLDDRPHTSAAAEYLAATGYAGADHYRDEPAVSGGGLITAGPTAPVAFAREIFAELGLYRPAALDAWYRLHAHSDPAAFAELMSS
ncbi:glutamine amidotransferase [Streptomonospora sp. PA3]|uniref:DJ-1/PfpI family protein n=1 Tax=Streptomonospora sp. PA3 TaxID=2607326 RepID=UPI0012DEDD95|nr:DJ-1/PfpI family protein [Streptomonospora sp. PA3]MUL42587.1 glutamine amidotransferase [Streptomonospora sp. PA3]